MQLNELSQDLHFDLPALLPWKREFGAGETPGQHLVGGQEPGLLVLGTVFATNPHHLGEEEINPLAVSILSGDSACSREETFQKPIFV